MPTAWAVEVLLPPGKQVPNFRSCENGAKVPLSSYRHAIKYTPGAANAEKAQQVESMRAIDILLGMMCHAGLSEDSCSLPSFSKRGVSSCTVLSSSSSASSASAASSVFSLNIPSREFLLASVTVAEERILPYELLREGAGVCGGETRAERMFKEFIVLSEP
jgi:hypothetical protein